MDLPRVIISSPVFLRGLAHGSGVDDVAALIISLIAAGLLLYFFLRDEGEGEIDEPEPGEDAESQD